MLGCTSIRALAVHTQSSQCNSALLTNQAGKFVHCYFCKTCTSHIYHHQDVMPEKIIVRTLLLEDGDRMPATAEIFADGRLAWVEELKGHLPSVS
jgi:hypothetical protein